MSWRDELLPATYNGIPFYVDTESLEFGRRIQLNEYPFSETPNTLNIGRKARKYTINAYVIGDEYLADRNALLEMIENTTVAGILTLPTLAPILVYPTDECQQVFNNQEGGRELFKLVFVEAGVNLFPSIGNDTQLQSALEAAQAAIAIYEDFKQRFATNSFPDFISGDASSKVEDFTNVIGLAAQTGVASQSNFSDFSNNLTAFQSNINTNIASADATGGGIKDLVIGLSTIYSSPTDAYNAQKQLAQYGSTYLPITVTTNWQQQQLDNQNALINSVVNTALIQMALSTSQMTFASRQDALTIRDEVAALIRARLFILGDQGNDTQFNALTRMLVKMVNDINARSATLKNIEFVQTVDSIPAIVFAYENYGTTDAEADVIARNNIRRPLFIPPGATLEVLK